MMFIFQPWMLPLVANFEVCLCAELSGGSGSEGITE